MNMATVVLLMQILQEEIFGKVNKWYGNQLIVALRITPWYALTTITVLNKLCVLQESQSISLVTKNY